MLRSLRNLIPILAIVVSLGCGGGSSTNGNTTANGPQIVVIGGSTINGKAGETVQFKVLVEPGNFQNIQFTWEISGPTDVKNDPNNPPKFITSGNEHTFVWTPRNDQAATYQLLLKVAAELPCEFHTGNCAGLALVPASNSVQVSLAISGSTEGISLLGNTTYPFSVSVETIEIDFQFDAPSVNTLDYQLTNAAEGMEIRPHPTRAQTARFTWEPTISQKGEGNKSYSFNLQAFEKGGSKKSPIYPIIVFLKKCESIDPFISLETTGQIWTDEGVRLEKTNTDYEFGVRINEKGTAIVSVQLCYYPNEDSSNITCIDMSKPDGQLDLYTGKLPNQNLAVGESKRFGVFFRITDACGKTKEFVFDTAKNWDFLLVITIPKPLDYGSLCADDATGCPTGFPVCDSTLKICTKECSVPKDCPANSDCIGSGPGHCVPSSRANCAPCKSDAECGPGGLCSQIGDLNGTPVKICSTFCDLSNPCPEGFDCTDSHCTLKEGQCKDIDRAGLCQECSAHSDCGDYKDRCIGLDANTPGKKGFCAQDCELAGCPFGYVCTNADNAGLSPDPINDPWGWQCLPPSQDCLQLSTPQEPTAQTLVINEIFANAKDIDSNKDGQLDIIDDEFIEVVNISDKPIDLTGVSLDDDDAREGYNFTFPDGTILKAGKAAIVFGGGDLAKIKSNDWGADNLVFLATGSAKLSLANGGDTLLLIYKGATLWTGSYGNTDKPISWNRQTDLNPSAPFVKHSEVPNASGNLSPGKTVDQTPF